MSKINPKQINSEHKEPYMSNDKIKCKLTNCSEASMVFSDHPELWKIWKHSGKELEVYSSSGKLLVTFQSYDKVFAIQAVRNTFNRILEEKKNDFPWMPVGVMVAKRVATWHDLTNKYMVDTYCSKFSKLESLISQSSATINAYDDLKAEQTSKTQKQWTVKPHHHYRDGAYSVFVKPASNGKIEAWGSFSVNKSVNGIIESRRIDTKHHMMKPEHIPEATAHLAEVCEAYIDHAMHLGLNPKEFKDMKIVKNSIQKLSKINRLQFDTNHNLIKFMR